MADPAGGRRTGQAVAPPEFFQRLVAGLSTVGFHRDTRERAWQGGTVCTAVEKRTAACKAIRRTWVVTVVADQRLEGALVVQGLWLFELASHDAAEIAARSLEQDFRYGPFAKRPYTIHVHGDHVVAVEQRARWRTHGERLAGYVRATLAEPAAGRP